MAGLMLACASSTERETDGDAGAPSSCVDAVRRLHGPPEWVQVRTRQTEFDLNADGINETVTVLFWELEPPDRIDCGILRQGVICNGFCVTTLIEGTTWPVFYDFAGDRRDLRLANLEDCAFEQLVSDGGRGGEQTRWGWINREEAGKRGEWDTSLRVWDATTRAYPPWEQNRSYSVNFSYK